jgi:diphthine synthase
MGKLSLIGLGLYDEKDLTLRGIGEAKEADEVFLDTYTGIWHGNLKKVEKLIGKKIQLLARKDLEENSSKLLEKALKEKIVILVQGDPLVATTHSSLLLEAKKMKIKTKVFHNSSIYSAIAESGLHIQKFGETVTIPFLERTGGKLPFSVYETIRNNKKLGLHTLCLLDLIVEEKKFMKISEAIDILLKLTQSKEKIYDENSYLVVMTKIGSPNKRIFFNKLSEIKDAHVSDLPAVLIIPGKLHFSEKEFLSSTSK